MIRDDFPDKLDYQRCEEIARDSRNLWAGSQTAYKVILKGITEWEQRSGDVPGLILHEIEEATAEGKPIYQLFLLTTSWGKVAHRENKLKYLMTFRPDGSVRYAGDFFGFNVELLNRVGPLTINGGHTGKYLKYEDSTVFGPISEDVFVPAEYMQIWSDVYRGKLPESVLEDWLQDNGYK